MSQIRTASQSTGRLQKTETSHPPLCANKPISSLEAGRDEIAGFLVSTILEVPMSLNRNQPSRSVLRARFAGLREHVDCERKFDSELVPLTGGIKKVRETCLDGRDVDDRMKAVADAIRALMNRGDVVFDYDRNFANELEDLRETQRVLHKEAKMHTLVGRSADKSTLFVVFAPTAETRCLAVGRGRRRR